LPKMRKPEGAPEWLLGADAADIAGLMGPLGLPAVLVTRFANPAARKAALAALKVDETLYPKISQALEWVKQRNPRVMAHHAKVLVDTPETRLGDALATSRQTDAADHLLTRMKGVPFSARPNVMTISPDVEKELLPSEIVELISHEATHGAQRLFRGNAKQAAHYKKHLGAFGDTDIARRAAYEVHPDEVAARAAGSKRADQFYKQQKALTDPARPKTGPQLRDALKERGYPQYDPSASDPSAKVDLMGEDLSFSSLLEKLKEFLR
jgi:hypothetical protein